eukprot:s3204_g13.t1
MADSKLVMTTAQEAVNLARTTLKVIIDRNQTDQLPRAFCTFQEAKLKMCQDQDVRDWIDRVKIPAPIVAALAFVMQRSNKEQVTQAIHLLMNLFTRVTVEEEAQLTVSDFIEKGARITKLFDRYAREDAQMAVLQYLCSHDCALRTDELWTTLKSQYSGANNMIPKDITVQQLRAKIANTSVSNLGSLNQSHPPLNSHCHQIRLRTNFADLSRKHWENWRPHKMQLRDDWGKELIEKTCASLGKMLKEEGCGLGYALRRHNARCAGNPASQFILQNVMEDWTSMRYDLPLERTAAVVHLQATLMAARLMHIWVDKLLETRWSRTAYDQLIKDLRDVKTALDIRDDIWQESNLRVRRPPAQLEPQPWDPYPIVMMTPEQIRAELQRRQDEEDAQAQSAPDPTAHPTHTMGGGSASSSAGGAAPPFKAPPTKARPKEPSVPPDWIIQKAPEGYIYKESRNPDYRDTEFTTSLWMSEKGQFLLAIMQGPAAASPHVSGWAQYLRRVATYGCMVLGVCNPRVVTEDNAAKISEIDWLRCYSHLVRAQSLARTGSYLSTASLLMMLGKHDTEVANQSGLAIVKKSIVNQVACKIVETPFNPRVSDALAGDFRAGTLSFREAMKLIWQKGK